MKTARILFIVFLFIITVAVTDLPNFHLDSYVNNYLGLNSSTISDIAFHGTYYFVITFPVFLLFHKRNISVPLLCFLFLIPALFEFSQALIPGRTLSAYDLFGNYLGIASALAICFILRYFFSRKRRDSAYSSSNM